MNESFFKEKNLLVVGGTGFIGSWVALSGMKRGYKVSVLSRNYPKLTKKIKNIDYLKADISNYQEVLNAIGTIKITHVINLAGDINHSKFREGGRGVIENHFVGLLNLVKALDLDFLRCFIQIGTSDEYGEAKAPQNEDQTCIPISNYSFAKLAGNNFLQMLYRTEQFPAIILRLFLVYGPGQDTTRFLPQIISASLKNKAFPVSAGEQLRDFCYVEDIVDGVFMALESRELFGNIINLASGKPVSIRSVIDRIVELIGSGKPIFGKLSYRDNENMELFANIEKAKKIMNWSPKIELNEGIAKTIEFYRSTD